jgi:hypothetical protein
MHGETHDIGENDLDVFSSDVSDEALEAAAPSDGQLRITLTDYVWTYKPCGPGAPPPCPSSR